MKLKSFSKLLLSLLLMISLASHGEELADWIQQESKYSIEKILRHISPLDGKPGAVIASSSRENPNYYFHWVRDSAITMKAIIRLYSNSDDPIIKTLYRKHLIDYTEFSRALQLTPSLSGLGEPKFNIDGSPFNKDWGRPQNDGPALRALVLIDVANVFLDEAITLSDTETIHWVKKALYDNRLPSESVIKNDLEYISNHWGDSCFDIWEEHYGHHFVTQYAQKLALEHGAKLAIRLGDPEAARWYSSQARQIQKQLSLYWNPSQKAFTRSLEQADKLDSSFVLAIVHMKAHNDFFLNVSDDQVLSTIYKLEKGFQKLYAINNIYMSPLGPMGPAIGRYFDDAYQGGNPWVLLSFAFAEFYYQLAKSYQDIGSISISKPTKLFLAQLKTQVEMDSVKLALGNIYHHDSPEYNKIIQALIVKGDSFLTRVRYHTQGNYELSEQIDKNTGAMISAKDLTWNYARFLFTVSTRTSVLNKNRGNILWK